MTNAAEQRFSSPVVPRVRFEEVVGDLVAAKMRVAELEAVLKDYAEWHALECPQPKTGGSCTCSAQAAQRVLGEVGGAA